jgi:tRNA modification GTPase
VDTAGMTPFPDSAEGIGVGKTYQAISDADAILIVIDRSRPPDNEDRKIKSELKNLSCIVVMNKNDLESGWSAQNMESFAETWPWIEVSAKFGSGIDGLRSLIFKSLFGSGGVQRDDFLITNIRHRQLLEALENEIRLAVQAFEEELSEEFPLMHLHKGLTHIGALTGETSVEDLLAEIFSRFCIGK